MLTPTPSARSPRTGPTPPTRTRPTLTPPTHRMMHAAVIVPASNEQDTIGGCLTAIDAAVAYAGRTRPELTTQVVVVLDRCVDGTADIVGAWTDVHVVVSSAGNVGAARDQGSRWALDHSPAPHERTWTAHTDADSLVPPDWLDHQLEHADAGGALVLGTVMPEVDGPLLAAWAARQRIRDGHPHVHGANLGMRAEVLRDLGGWGSHALHEDVELVRRAERAGCDIRRTGGAVVTTSGRLVGRTQGGLAGYLRDLATDLSADLGA